MDRVSSKDLELLTKERTGMCVSLYLQTGAGVSDARQAASSFNNALSAVQDELIAHGINRAETRSFIRPAREYVSSDAFREPFGKGLAVFLGEGFFRPYHLPIAFTDMLVVSGRFHVQPLLPLLTEDSDYYLLVLGRTRIRLFEGSRFGLIKAALPGVPEAGEGKMRDDENVSRFFPQINTGLVGLVPDKNVPLLLAGVEYLLPLYRQANTHPGMLEAEIKGDLDDLSAEALREQAWPLVEPHFRLKREKALKQLHAVLNTEKASTAIKHIVSASYQGRISTLFVTARKHEWGIVDRSKGGALIRACKREEEGCEDIFDFAAINTLLKGGKVFVVEGHAVTEGVSIAAVFQR